MESVCKNSVYIVSQYLCNIHTCFVFSFWLSIFVCQVHYHQVLYIFNFRNWVLFSLFFKLNILHIIWFFYLKFIEVELFIYLVSHHVFISLVELCPFTKSGYVDCNYDLEYEIQFKCIVLCILHVCDQFFSASPISWHGYC